MAAEIHVFDPFPANEAPLHVVASSQRQAPARVAWDDGSKFAGGFGWTEQLIPDYWTLRTRSAQLYETNLYARGLIRRLVQNVINTGLHLEATPEETLLGYPEDGLAEWTETTENLFSLWANNPKLCDQTEQNTFGALQAAVFTEALVVGDVLCVLRQDQRTQLPRLQLINGANVQTPLGGVARTANKVVHGVELDSMGRQVAYWVTQEDGSSKRLPATGEKSGRRLAWLVYGTDKRMDDVRGKPLLALVLQSLKEIDRYRDSTQRKATVLSMLAMFIAKGEAGPGTRPLTSAGAMRRDALSTSGAPDPATERSFNASRLLPGLSLDELQKGEEPKAFQTNGTVESFGDFEDAIMAHVAWGNGVPPEILTLSFTNNYSASQAAINEFKLNLNTWRTSFGDCFCQPTYIEWLRAVVLTRKLEAPGMLEAANDNAQYDIFAAWVASDWSGHIKPAVDLSKLVTGYEKLLDRGLITYDRASRELTGTKFSKNVKKITREIAALAKALEPLKLLEALTKPKPVVQAALDPTDDTADADEPVKQKKAS